MKRRKTKYSMAGERVTIVKPAEFVRCGYPLSIKDVLARDRHEIEKECMRLFCALTDTPVPPSVEPETDNFLISLAAHPAIPQMSATVHGMLCSAIAAYRLEKKNFGGGERRIFERPGPFKKGQVWTVTGRKMVKTGKRFPSSSWYDSYTGEHNYEPGGLENKQSHCVYRVKRGYIEAMILAANTAREVSA